MIRPSTRGLLDLALSISQTFPKTPMCSSCAQSYWLRGKHAHAHARTMVVVSLAGAQGGLLTPASEAERDLVNGSGDAWAGAFCCYNKDDVDFCNLFLAPICLSLELFKWSVLMAHALIEL
jgi:hypothetical protein